MTRDLRSSFVYPGHPVTIAIEITRAFPSYAAAIERTKDGWESALSHSDVRGAGGAVRTGLHVLRLVNDGMTPEAAFDDAARLWQAARSGDFKANMQEGQKEADALRSIFIEEVGAWNAARG